MYNHGKTGVGGKSVANQNRAALKLIGAMLIFGSIGLFVRYISLDSGFIALVRAVIGVIFLLTVIFLRRHPISFAAVRKNFVLLCVSGAAIGFNWILLFESYRFVSVAVGTLCYYMAPILVILLSPLVLKERLTLRKCVCIAAAFIGMALISSIGTDGLGDAGSVKGILLGLGAAGLYASVMLMNKHITNIGAFDKTIVQLAVAAIVLLPYNLLTVNWSGFTVTAPTVALLALVGIVHTGFAYYLYFSSMEHLSGQSIAIFSYIDPVVAVLASVILLKEPFTWINAVGALLIIGSAAVSELNGKGRGK